MAIAIRIVRAYTGKEKILFCGYHGWHDWYLSANLGSSTALDGQLLPGLDPRGVPRELRNTALPFVYNSIASFKKMVEKHGNNIAAVVMEPVRSVWPNPGFLDQIREITRERKIPLVFDEITSGFRMLTGGVHLSLGVMPDVAVFAKALGNGFPMAAIIGKGAIMQAAQKTFISSTYWTDRIGPTAALATLKKHSEKKVGRHLVKIGSLVQAGWGKLAKKHNLSIKITGIPPLSHWHIEAPQSDLAHTFIANKMLEKGFLTSRAFYPTNSHSEDSVRRYLSALDEILEYSAPYIHQNAVHRIYRGPVAHAGFKRLT
jgi:glutamate-1-semialdehyde aminotransferase